MGEKNKVVEIQKVMEKSWNFSTAYREACMRNSDNSISIGLLQWFGYGKLSVYHTDRDLRNYSMISVPLSFDFHGNRSHDALRARPMCCSQPDGVPFLFEFVRMWSSYTIKRLCVVFASLHRQRRCRIPPTVSQEKITCN